MQGHLVPHPSSTDDPAHTSFALETPFLTHVLVVEKDAVFRALLGSPAFQPPHLHQPPNPAPSLYRTTLLLTGKGYPDLSTRHLLRALSASASLSGRPPRALALVDWDPHGLAIALCYARGSRAMPLESARARVPSLRLLGVRCEDVVAHAEGPGGEEGEGGDGLLRMTARDRAKARSVLERIVASEEEDAGGDIDGPLRPGVVGSSAGESAGEEDRRARKAELRSWRREAQLMLLLDRKAEIEALEEREGGVAAWVAGRLAEV